MDWKPACVALDLDGTTLRTGSVLSAYTREVLEAVIARGVRVVVASGRPYHALPREVLEIPGVEYAVCSNGATVWHVPTGACIRRVTLPPEAAGQVMEALARENIRYECYIGGRPYADAAYVADPVACGAPPRAIPYVQSTRQPVDDIAGFLRSHAGELEGLDVILADPSRKPALWERLTGLRDDLYITFAAPHLLEIAHRDAGKRAGLEAVLAGMGIAGVQTAAFGDADNDIDMLEWAGLGVAMANATEGAKRAADRVALSNDEDGVARVLAEIFGI